MCRAFAFVFVASFALAACAAPASYMGISFVPGATPTELQQLAMRAQNGDKQAQLDLGIAYEEGRGIAVDLKRARALYKAAATTIGGTIYVYTPPVKQGGRGMVMPVNLGSVVTGLPVARVRLKMIGVKQAPLTKGIE